MKISTIFIPTKYYTKEDTNKLLSGAYYNKTEIDTTFAIKDYVDGADNQLAVLIQSKADLVNDKVPSEQLPAMLSETDVKTLSTVFTTTGVRNAYTLTIPEVKTMNDLKDKVITIRLHTDATFGANVTLNINNLGAFNISNFESQNTSFRISTLPGYILSLVWNGSVFVMCDFGATNPVDGGAVNQIVGGQKTFTKQLETNSNTGVGLTNANSYIYMKQATNVTDSVGDCRIYCWDGFIYGQICTVASPTKGAGTWVTKSKSTAV